MENQSTINDLFNCEEMTWFGLDFSHIKLIGAKGFSNPQEIKNRYFNAWNQLFITEQKKFVLNKFFRKKRIQYDLRIVESRNAIPDPTALIIEDNYEISVDLVKQIIGEYDTSELNGGIGTVFIMESFNAYKNRAFLHAVFFDIKSKNVLLTTKLEDKARGFGIRNFWMGAIHKILIRIEKSWRKWEKEYNK